MSTPPGEYYTEERWNNWLDRLRDEDIDPEDEDSARLLLNLQDDAAIAVVKIVAEYEDGEIDDDAALEELARVRDIVLSEVDFEDEEKRMLIDGVQTSLVCVFYAAEEYVAGGPPEEGSVTEYIRAAADAEAEEDVDAALAYCAQAGTLLFDGESLDMDVAEDIEYGLVAEWVNGLDSLGTALADPEVIDEDE
ncbi:DUF2150 family protein [Natronomonas gomsonensis]|jgi:hypothetical protein|uniref:DUF2150 family protein n=1 Tax=Natronomonas TaxID=63743 RepID=UPI0012E9C91A|nr:MULTISPECIES: DUF2150 family protein [Natronomonas]MCY4731215.1 DUF2150 family protein [Natronomonas gomsonensis]MUV85944.1 DUF2150 family protein [Natronomonas sp. CBA1123]